MDLQPFVPFEQFPNFRQMGEIDVMGLQSSSIRRLGLRADQGVRPATALGHVRRVEFLSVDDLVQVLPSLLSQRKP
jgi:hypothetical protein